MRINIEITANNQPKAAMHECFSPELLKSLSLLIRQITDKRLSPENIIWTKRKDTSERLIIFLYYNNIRLLH